METSSNLFQRTKQVLLMYLEGQWVKRI